MIRIAKELFDIAININPRYMADFLTTTGTLSLLENLIIEAKTKLVLISPYVQLSDILFERLKDASTKGVKITIVHGKVELELNEKNLIAQLKNVELFFLKNLHAKCYFNETKMLITSMNLYDFSKKNREMGVLIDRQADTQLFDKAVEEAKSIIQLSIENKKTEIKFAGTVYYGGQKSTNSRFSPTNGYCLRCETRIPFNPSKPYCPDCYADWARDNDPDDEEDYCHSCGEDFETTTKGEPFCYNCCKKLNGR